MSKEALQAIVGRAIIDKEFERKLLSRSHEALAEFDLTKEEKEVICSIKATSLEQFARQLHNYLIDSREAREALFV